MQSSMHCPGRGKPRPYPMTEPLAQQAESYRVGAGLAPALEIIAGLPRPGNTTPRSGPMYKNPCHSPYTTRIIVAHTGSSFQEKERGTLSWIFRSMRSRRQFVTLAVILLNR